MVKAIIFDIGGVLALDVWEHLLLGKDGIASIFNLDGRRVQDFGAFLWEQYSIISSNDPTALENEYWDRLKKEFNFEIDKPEIDILTEKHIKAVEGMPELLGELHQKGVKLSVCSNNTEFWFIRQANRINLFQHVLDMNMILSSRIGKPKSSQGFEMYRAAVNALGVPINDCLFIDDRIESLRQANKFGLPGVLFPAASSDGAPYLRKLFEILHIL
jgi:HAD superfamily hydrolase (TIGR01509 family)